MIVRLGWPSCKQGCVSGARANVIQDYVERSQRPVMTTEQALVKLLDARGILYELEVIP
jgi:hypothetical protein